WPTIERARARNGSTRGTSVRPGNRAITSRSTASRSASAAMASFQYAGVVIGICSPRCLGGALLHPAFLPPRPGAAHVHAPRPIHRKVADKGEEQREQRYPDEERLADARQPMKRGGQPLAVGLSVEFQRDGRCAFV